MLSEPSNNYNIELIIIKVEKYRRDYNCNPRRIIWYFKIHNIKHLKLITLETI